MEFERTVRIKAPLDQLWALTDDLETVAACIPGVSDFHMETPQVFRCRLSQRVGSVKANFDLRNELTDIAPGQSLTVVSQGNDRALNSAVKANQTFHLRGDGDETEIDINATIKVTGRIATFGGRIILAKAEQVTIEALENLAKVLESN